MLARRVNISAKYLGVDITKSLQKDLLSFEYVDNASEESDSISIDLKDEKHIWLKDWFPEKGDVILPMIKTTNWRKEGDKQHLPCGRFFIDEPSYSGRPSTFSLKGVSAPLNSNFTDTDRSRRWKNITLKSIAGDIAKRAGLSLQYIGKNNPRYKDKEQSETPDSTFLSDLCEEEGLAMKVTDAKIVIFDEREFEKRPSVATYKEWGKDVLDYSFKTSLINTKYAGVSVKYYDPRLKKTIKYLYMIEDIDEDSKIYKLNKKVSGQEEARRIAQKKLRNLNKKETTGSLTLFGNIEILGGTCITLKEFGAFDGKYYVQKATHSVGGGYTTDVEVRKVIGGY
ncbi:phage late control D family protein [Virgibacillus halodenitrificans]|uniref:phage late control D family protein n=1 Tax=Virgibacillus halodenitrificans TaxID=1482 RepID=UPI000EF4B29D|nr:contractile injection system protein, VgrG/Pvc8 family [Virgibacillus halodenitrificans]